MRIVKRVGLAGLPGVSLDERDVRQIASYFRGGSSSGLGGLGAACSTCKGSTGSPDRDIAGAVADTLGLGELADAARDDSIPAPMGQANLLASATMAAAKFKGDQVAVLDGVTNPTFRKAVLGAASKLRGKMPADKAYLSALTLCYTNGAIDAAAGRNTPMARGFRRASGQLSAALKGKSHPQALEMLAGLGQIGEYASKHATYSPPPSVEGVSIEYRDVGSYVPTGMSFQADWGVGSPNAPVFLNSPEYYYPKPRENVKVGDLGSATAPPDEVVIVDAFTVVHWLQYLQSTKVREKRLATLVAGNPKDGFDHNAKLLAAWVYRQLSADQIRRIYAFWGDLEADDQVREKSKYRISEAFVAGCYGLSIAKTDRGGNLSAEEKRIVELLLLARPFALQRTGQIGVYGSDGTWVAGTTGEQQYPFNAVEAAQPYITANFRTLQAKPSAARVAFASRQYRASYRKEPTVSAMNWYGSFLYPIDEGNWLSGALKEKEYAARIAKLESVRMAGAAPPPEDLVDNSNIFMQMFNSLGPGLGWVLDQINAGVKYAIEALCGMFKTLMGPEVGGVLCTIFTALLKIISGGLKGGIAAIMSVGKALAGAIGNLAQGKWMEAAQAFFVGVNTAVVFLMGGLFADLLGIPFLKTEEKQGADLSQSLSLERMAEELTIEDPLFIVNLTLAVIAAITAKFTPASVGGLMVALAPVVGLVLSPKISVELAKSTDPALAKYKQLPRRAIASAVGSLVKLIAAIVVGALSVGGFVAAIGAELKKFADREGGAGAALVATLQFFVQNLASELTTIIGAVSIQPFDLNLLLDGLWNLLTRFLLLIPVFASNAGFSETGQKAAASAASIASQAAAEAGSIARNMKAQVDFAVANPGVPAQLPGGGTAPATTCTPGAGGKVVETKYITRTQTRTVTETSIPMLVGVAVVGLALGIAITRR